MVILEAPLTIGGIVPIRISGAMAYDLTGYPLSGAPTAESATIDAFIKS
jgi:hypothetical protein